MPLRRPTHGVLLAGRHLRLQLATLGALAVGRRERIAADVLVLGLESVQLAHQGDDSIAAHGSRRSGPCRAGGGVTTHLFPWSVFALRTSSDFALIFPVNSTLTAVCLLRPASRVFVDLLAISLLRYSTGGVTPGLVQLPLTSGERPGGACAESSMQRVARLQPRQPVPPVRGGCWVDSGSLRRRHQARPG